MTRGTKIYAFFIASLISYLAFVFLYESPKVGELNDQLESIQELKNFPFKFKVIQVKNNIATVTSPRSTQVPVSQILGILFPSVKGRDTQSSDFQKAQKSLAKVQTLVRDTIIADKEIKRVKWKLDENWLLQHGVIIN